MSHDDSLLLLANEGSGSSKIRALLGAVRAVALLLKGQESITTSYHRHNNQRNNNWKMRIMSLGGWEDSQIMKAVMAILLVKDSSSQAATLILKGDKNKILSLNGICVPNMNPMNDRHSNMNRSDRAAMV